MNKFKCLMTHSTCYSYQVGVDHKHTGIVVHDTAAGNPNISRYVQPYEGDKNYDKLIEKLGKNKYNNDWNHVTQWKGVHAFIGKLADGSVATCEVLEPGMDAWGVGKGRMMPKGTTYYKDERFKVKGGKLEEDTMSSDAYTFKWTEYDSEGKEIQKSHSVAKIVINKCTYYVNPDNGLSYNFLPTSYFQFEICDDYDEVKNPKPTATEEYFLACMKEAQEYCKYLVQAYRLSSKNIVSHHESYVLGYGCDHGDCDGWMSLYGYNMDWFRREVSDLIKISPYAAFRGDTYIGCFKNFTDATMSTLGADSVWVEDECIWTKPEEEEVGSNEPVVVGGGENPEPIEESGETVNPQTGLSEEDKEEAMNLFIKIFEGIKKFFSLIFGKKE